MKFENSALVDLFTQGIRRLVDHVSVLHHLLVSVENSHKVNSFLHRRWARQGLAQKETQRGNSRKHSSHYGVCHVSGIILEFEQGNSCTKHTNHINVGRMDSR